MKRGEVYIADLRGSVGRRPVVILTRTAAARVRMKVTVAHVTTRIRGLEFEVPLGPDDGLELDCVVTCDDIATIPKTWLEKRVSLLGYAKQIELDRALIYALQIS